MHWLSRLDQQCRSPLLRYGHQYGSRHAWRWRWCELKCNLLGLPIATALILTDIDLVFLNVLRLSVHFGCEHSACDFVINCGPDLTFGDTGVMSNIQIGQVSTKRICNNSTGRAWMVSVHVCSHYIISCVLSQGARRLHYIIVSTLLDQAACNCVEAHRNGCCGILVVSGPTIHPVTHVLLTNRGAREGNHSGAIDHKE